MDIKYRKMKISDITNVMLVEQSIFEGTATIIHDMTSHILNQNISFICFDKANILGFVKSSIDEGKIAHIQVLGVLKTHRRLKIGSNLLRLSINAIKSINSDITIKLYVSIDNTSAIKLYESFGFVIESIIPGFYSNNKDAYLMYLN